jgi:prevent-host-death family protein
MMIQANIHEIKSKLSEYLAAVSKGETVIIARRNVPIAEIKPIAATRKTPRPLGQGPREDNYELPESFWEPLPEELLEAFGGENSDGKTT